MGQIEYEYMDEQTGKQLMLPCFFYILLYFGMPVFGFPSVL